MKSGILTCFIAMTFAVLAAPFQLAAQRTLYKVIDTGTLGGPNSSLGFEGERDMNNSGTLVSLVDLSALSTPPFCFSAGPNECHVGHTAEWRNGELTDLGALGLGGSGPIWISDSGLISGLSQNGMIDPLTGSPELEAVLWKDGRIIDLGTLGGNESVAGGVNDRGQVVGCATNAVPDSFNFCVGVPQQSRAFLWQDGVMQDLGTLGGPDAIADIVNARGQVAGYSFTDSVVNPATGIPTEHPFLWEKGKMRDLGTIGGTVVAAVNDINNQGQIVGDMTVAGDQSVHPFLWNGRSLQDLGTLGGDFGFANAVNERSEVVGVATNQNNQAALAFLWKNGAMTNLGVVGEDVCSTAMAINSKEQIVGGSDDCAGGNANAFLWERNSIIGLNSFIPSGSGVRLTVGLAINERGEIAAQGVLSNGDIHAFVLIPCEKGIDGCRDAAENTTTANQNKRAPTFNNSTMPQLAHRPNEVMAAWRARLVRRYHIPGLGAPTD
jgi:probable HAF family extracellular repeat protein